MITIKRLFRFGAATVFLLAAACSSDDVSQEYEMNEEEIQPVYTEVENTSIITQESVPLEDFSTETIPSHTDVTYDLDLQMDEDGTFHLNAHITAQNQSNDSWEHLVFYVVPNVFTEENKPESVRDASELEMETVQVNGENVPYSLSGDTLAMVLESPLESGESAEATISYTFTVPEDGIRFLEYEGNYFLAQFYPMLATYQNGWNKEDYNGLGESYHTDFSDFSVTYDIPEGYTVFSSSDQETSEESDSGKLEMEHIKEYYMAILATDDLEVQHEDVNGTEIRVISNSSSLNADIKMDTAKGSLGFFEKHIGPYPHEQLDVIMTESDEGGMEYPGIVTVIDSIQDTSEVIAHEIAHQWFYGMVSNDAFHDPWVDEGITQFATYLYLLDAYDELHYEELMEAFEEMMGGQYAEYVLPANLPLDAYEDDRVWTYSLSVYSQTTYQLLQLFHDHGGAKTALQFLHDYFETYQYEQVDSDELLNYLISYLQIEDVSVFDEWLEVED